MSTTNHIDAAVVPFSVTVEPVVVSDAPDAHRVMLHVGVQHFTVGSDYRETWEEAEWFAAQLRQALKRAGARAADNSST